MADIIVFFIFFDFNKRRIGLAERFDLANYRFGLSLNNFEKGLENNKRIAINYNSLIQLTDRTNDVKQELL
jgi:hypothetical protein